MGSEHAVCEHASSCPATPALIGLAESLARFQREASRATCETGRYRCSYFSWGQGPPLVFIPGLSDQALSFVMAAALLAPRFRCIGYDLPLGRGDGARLRGYRHADLVDDLFALLDHLGIRQSYVLGSSFGSTVALAALRRHPERLPRAVLQGGFARRPLAPTEILLASMARYWSWPMRRIPFRRQLVARNHHAPFATRPTEVWEFLLERWGSTPMSAVAQRALLMHRLDLRPLLREVRQPVLLVCGDADPLVHRHCEAELLAGLPNAGRVEIGGCGHNPQYTHPDALAEIISQFLSPQC